MILQYMCFFVSDLPSTLIKKMLFGFCFFSVIILVCVVVTVRCIRHNWIHWCKMQSVYASLFLFRVSFLVYCYLFLWFGSFANMACGYYSIHMWIFTEHYCFIAYLRFGCVHFSLPSVKEVLFERGKIEPTIRLPYLLGWVRWQICILVWRIMRCWSVQVQGWRNNHTDVQVERNSLKRSLNSLASYL